MLTHAVVKVLLQYHTQNITKRLLHFLAIKTTVGGRKFFAEAAPLLQGGGDFFIACFRQQKFQNASAQPPLCAGAAARAVPVHTCATCGPVKTPVATSDVIIALANCPS